MDMVLEDEEEVQQRQQQKRIKTSENPQSVPSLLPEIIVEVLKRLPVESLLRSRSVCKLWCSIISDSHFIKSHLSLSTSNSLYTHHRFIFSTLTTQSRRSYLKSCPLYDVLHVGFVNALELDYPLKNPLKFVSISGSCNGLLLIRNEDKTLFIWNPSTRRSKRLPSTGSERCSELYCFGYDESNDDYKVVGMSSGPDDTIFKIYSLKTGNWKRIGAFHNGYSWDNNIKYLSGAFHWIAGSSGSLKLVSLDLANESFGEILQPVYDEGFNDMTFGAFGEWLCMLCDYLVCRDCVDVWVMKVYGVKDSWTKLVSIPYLTPDWYQFSVPLCISNDGNVLLQFGAKLVVYDSKNCSFSEIQNFYGCYEAYTFVESLVSPDSPAAGSGDNIEG